MADNEDNVTLTLAYLREKFEEFNVQMFGGQLPMPRLRIGKSRTMLGNVRYKRVKQPFHKAKYTDFILTISSYYTLPRDVMEDTIIHEMIHYYILYFQMKDSSSHGVIFQRMMNDINMRFGRNISISYRNHGLQNAESAVTKQYVVCISELPDGTLGVTIPCRGKIQQMVYDLPRYYNVKSLRWYNSKDPIFATVPKSRTPKIYKVNQSRLLKALEAAIPLK